MRTVILGSTLEGIRLALSLKGEGQDVLLVSQSTYFGEDLTATWAGYGVVSKKAWLGEIGALLPGFDGPLLAGRVKRDLARLLCERGVELRYMSRAIGLRLGAKGVRGVLLADKLGITEEPCDRAYDATLCHTASGVLLGRPVRLHPGERAAVRLEYRGVPLAEDEVWLDAPRVRLERGEAARDQAYMTVEMRFDHAVTLREARAALWERAVACAEAFRQSGRYPDAELANALPHGILCPERARDFPEALNPPCEGREGDLIGGILRTPCRTDGAGRLFVASEGLPCVRADVLVTGGGTAGVRAALAAAERGSRTVLVEFFAHCGGTRTMGGVQLLYYGNRHRLFQKMWDEIDGFSRRLNGGQVYSRFGAAEALLYGEKIRQLGVEYDPCCLACGVEAHDGRIDGVLFVDEERVFTVCARNVVDATGDGDLARLAGIPMETGDRATGGVQNYSQLYRFSGTEYDRAGGDPDTMHPEGRSEWARALTQDLCACAEYDMVEMLTVRESSRIVGEHRVTLRDVARGTVQPDALMDAYSRYDPHARCFSLPGRLGLMPELGRARYVSIPYRSLLCREVRNLLVVGKALSMDQEAFNYCRMCADVMTLGRLAGQIAAEAEDLRRFDVTDLQREMQEAGALIRPPRAQPYDSESPDKTVSELLSGEEDAFVELVLCDWPQARDRLLAALKSGNYRRRELMIRALLWYREPSVMKEACSTLFGLVEQYGDQPYDDRQDDGLIRGGVEGNVNPYWKINQYALLLARSGCREALPAMEKAIRQVTPGAFYAPDRVTYGSLRVDCLTNSHYDRMLSMAEAVVRMPDARLGEAMACLLSVAEACCAAQDNIHMDYLLLRVAYAASLCGVEEAREVLWRKERAEHAMSALHAGALIGARGARHDKTD